VAEWLERSSLVPKVPGSKHRLCAGFFNKYLCSRMGTRLSSEVGKVKGEVTPLLEQVGL